MKKIIWGSLIIGIIILLMSYLDIGFDENLIRQDNLPQSLDPQAFEQFTDLIGGDKIDSEISGTFIGKGVNADNITTGQMSFDRAKGGTLILGGQDNSNGIFSLRDENDTEKILLNKEGMTINDGKIIIKDQNNKSIINNLGVTPDAVFTYIEAQGGTDVSIPNSNWVTTAALPQIILTKPTRIIFFYWADTAVGTAGDIITAAFTYISGQYKPYLVFDQTYYQTFSATHSSIYQAGVYNFSLTAQRTSGTGTGNVQDSYISAIIFGSY